MRTLYALAGLLKAYPAITAAALAVSLRDARDGYPSETYFIDSEASGAWGATIAILVVTLALGGLLVLLARKARTLGGVVAALSAVIGALCVAANPLSMQWDPDGHELVEKFHPGWYQPALAVVTVLAVALAAASIAVVVRGRRG